MTPLAQQHGITHNARGLPRQRWPAPFTTSIEARRRDKLAFRLSTELREQITALADLDQLPVSSWLEQVVAAEVQRRKKVKRPSARRTVHAR